MSPPPRRPSVIVVGGGVSGLTSALVLARAGFAVQVWAKSIGRQTTSGVAAALWFPYRVFPADRVSGWARASYVRFMELCEDPDTGVGRRELIELFPGEPDRPDWRSDLSGFRRARRDELPDSFGSGWVYSTPIIETPIYLPWLVAALGRHGVAIVCRSVGSLAEASARADLVVHAAGLGARELAHDRTMTPVRGQLVLLRGASAARAWVDDHGPHGVRYIVPRHDGVVIGGTVVEGSESTHIDPATTARLVAAGIELEPDMNTGSPDPRAGVRPCRSEVRLELERTPTGPVIHNYGHGGAGITLSWGCAGEVERLAAKIWPKVRHSAAVGE